MRAAGIPGRGQLAFISRAEPARMFRYATDNGDLYSMFLTNLATYAPPAQVEIDATLAKVFAAVNR